MLKMYEETVTQDHTLYFFLRRIISGKCVMEPSMLYMPSTIIRIFFQGLRVRGCPYTTASRSSFSRQDTSEVHIYYAEAGYMASIDVCIFFKVSPVVEHTPRNHGILWLIMARICIYV
jgi:hypothetical protein